MLQPSDKHATIDDINIGDSVVLEKTISESDVYLFAGICGDFSPNHVNERYMKGSVFKTRIAQGALIVGFTSAAAAMFVGGYLWEALKALSYLPMAGMSLAALVIFLVAVRRQRRSVNTEPGLVLPVNATTP